MNCVKFNHMNSKTLSDYEKRNAVMYVELCGFRKNRLAKYLGISRPTLDKILKNDDDFFTQIKAANENFCKDLINLVKIKNPVFLLEKMFPEEFGENVTKCDNIKTKI